MKIIAAVNNRNFLVEMEEDEIARAAGFFSTFDNAWERLNGGKAVKVGTVIQVNAAYDFHSRVSSHQDKAKSAAGILKALAEMLENALPDVVIPPIKTERGEA